MICMTEGCRRAAVRDWTYCDPCRRKILDSYRERRVEVRRVGVKPLPEMTELEKRWLDGDR